ncbi:phosphate metabolism protein 7 [Coemansia thaxteri]|uniref:Phosphate metabolism protein 7 n=1 Tax=Coemansia thaxteri TaxID=2663907 RepID=A0A9W8EGK3_9FUNG|nr:phosphate metabolism protein 7 [Coemansia thaxteri]
MAGDSDAKSSPNTVSTFVSSLTFNLVIAAAIFIAFCVLRPRFKRVYAPRTYAVSKDKRSAPIGSSPLAWIAEIFRVNDDVIVARVGLDTYMFLRFMRTMFIIFFVLSILSVVTILPTNITGGVGLTGLGVLTMGNVDPESPKLWVHIVFFIIFVVWVMRAIFGELDVYTRLRVWWLTNPKHAEKVGTSTILVSTLPAALTDNDTKLASMFNMFPGGVRQIIVNRNCSKLEKVVEERDKLVGKLESVLTSCAVKWEKAHAESVKKGTSFKEPARPMVRASKIPFKGPKLDAAEYYSTRIAALNGQIGELGGDQSKFKRQSSAFVLFHKQLAAHMSAQTVLDYKPLSMNSVSLDINPDDIIWSNLNLNPYDRRMRGYISFAATVGLVIVWTILTAALSGLISVQNLKKIPALSNMSDSMWFGLFSGIVPAVVLAVLMALLPIILRLLLRLEGTPRVSEVNLRLLHRFFFFQVWNVYLVTIFSTSILTVASSAAQNPGMILTLISTNVPQSATPILVYVLLLAFTGAAKEILQIAPLALRYVLPLLFAKTPRAIRNAETPAEFDWATSIPMHTLVFLMGFSYSFIAPIVNCFVAVYFGLYYLVYRYQFLYVYNDANWVTGGLSFPKSIQQIMVGVYISEIYMLLMMVAKVASADKVNANGIVRVVFTALTLLITIGAHLYINDTYLPIINYLPVRAAAEIEENPNISTKFPDFTSDGDLGSETQGANSAKASENKIRRRIYTMYGSLVPKRLIDYVLYKIPSLLHPKRHGSPDSTTSPQDKASYGDEEEAVVSGAPISSDSGFVLPMPTAHHYNDGTVAADDNALGISEQRFSQNTNMLSLASENAAAMQMPMPSSSIHSYTSESELRKRRSNAPSASSAGHRRSLYDQPSNRLLADAGDNALAEAFSNPALRAKPLSVVWVPLDSNRLCSELYQSVMTWGAGTIKVVTGGTQIDSKFNVTAEVDFDLEEEAKTAAVLTAPKAQHAELA